MKICKSFEPSINNNSRILILGSMPGVKSLEEQQYYAHPQNRFWKVMSALCNEDLINCRYDMRLNILLNNSFALWDTIGFCERDRSLDSNIQNEEPNNIRDLLVRFPNIKTICLNGNKSYSAFKKYFSDILINKQYKIYPLPSTSPANARYRLDDLLKEWRKVKTN